MRVHRTQRADIEKQVVGLCRPHTAHNADTAPAIKSRSASRQPFRPPPADAGHLAQKLIWIPPLAIAGPGTAAVWLAHIGEKFRPARNRLLEPARKRPPIGRSHFPGPQSLARSADHIAVGIFPRRAIWIRGRIAEVIRDLHKPTLAPRARPLALRHPDPQPQQPQAIVEPLIARCFLHRLHRGGATVGQPALDRAKISRCQPWPGEYKGHQLLVVQRQLHIRNPQPLAAPIDIANIVNRNRYQLGYIALCAGQPVGLRQGPQEVLVAQTQCPAPPRCRRHPLPIPLRPEID